MTAPATELGSTHTAPVMVTDSPPAQAPELATCCKTDGTIQVVHLQRKPYPSQFSIEILFAGLREAMRELGQNVVPAIAPYHSKGFWPRLANTWWAMRNQRDVNHITGDVHYLALGLPPKRTILTIHDCYPLERFSGVKRWLYRVLWFDLPLRQSAIVTVISEATKQQLMRHVPVLEEKVVVIPDAASSIFRPCPRLFREECPQILQVGTGENKNLPRLIEALKGMKCHLKIVGIPSDKTRCQLNEVGVSYEATANLDEAGMYRAYCEADLVSFASTYEGFGMPIIEAQWVERPVVTSNCSSMPEVAGEGACLVNPFDVDSIRQGLRRVIEDRAYREHLVEQGRRNRERFSLDEVARQYLSLYERLSGS